MRIALTSDLHAGFTEKTGSIHEIFFNKLNEEDWDILIIAGDLGSTKIAHVKSISKRIQRLINKPVLVVRGNHDLWDKSKYNVRETLKLTEQIFKDNGIHLLSNNPFKLNNLHILGWDGWYQHLYPPTRDEDYIAPYTNGKLTFRFLQEEAERTFQKILDKTKEIRTIDNQKIICVTHMPCFYHPTVYGDHSANQRYINYLEGFCDILCFGHTHVQVDDTQFGIRILNAGSDYDEPAYTIFNIQEDQNEKT